MHQNAPLPDKKSKKFMWRGGGARPPSHTPPPVGDSIPLGASILAPSAFPFLFIYDSNTAQDWCTRPVVSAYAAWHQMVSICTEWWCMEANEATQTHCYNPIAPAYPIWAYYVHGRQRRWQEDPVSLPSGRLEKTTRLSQHHVAQHHPTGSETTPPYAPWSSRFGSEPPSVEDDVDVWRYATQSWVACQKRRLISGRHTNRVL